MKSYLLLILGMMIVTYIPRLIPVVMLSQKPMPPVVRQFLLFIPYTALGALIIPGVTKATPEMPLAALAGIGAAAVFSWFRGGMILSVLISIGTTYLVLITR